MKLNNKGFSILEIIIVMTIMAVFATMAARSIKTAMTNKEKIDAHLRVEAIVFDALQIMKTDLEMAFHYTNPFYELDRNAIIAASTPANGNNNNQGGSNAPVPGQQPTPANPQLELPPRPPKHTQFIGRSDSLHFTTLNHRRTIANSQESDQIEVGYFRKDCKPRGKKKAKSSSCLWRRTALTIDDNVERGGKAVVLVENVEEFSLEYVTDDPNEKQWRQEWKSDRNGDALTKDKFPYMIKITLAVADPTKAIAPFKQTVIASIRNPNNTDPAKVFAPQQPAPNGQLPPGQVPVAPTGTN